MDGYNQPGKVLLCQIQIWWFRFRTLLLISVECHCNYMDFCVVWDGNLSFCIWWWIQVLFTILTTTVRYVILMILTFDCLGIFDWNLMSSKCLLSRWNCHLFCWTACLESLNVYLSWSFTKLWSSVCVRVAFMRCSSLVDRFAAFRIL